MSHVMSELHFLRFDDFDVIILWIIVQLYHFTNLKKWRAKTKKTYHLIICDLSPQERYQHNISRSFWVQFFWEIWYGKEQIVSRLGCETESPEIHQDSPKYVERIEYHGARGAHNFCGDWPPAFFLFNK